MASPFFAAAVTEQCTQSNVGEKKRNSKQCTEDGGIVPHAHSGKCEACRGIVCCEYPSSFF